MGRRFLSYVFLITFFIARNYHTFFAIRFSGLSPAGLSPAGLSPRQIYVFLPHVVTSSCYQDLRITSFKFPSTQYQSHFHQWLNQF